MTTENEVKKTPFTTFDHYTFYTTKGIGKVTVAMHVDNDTVNVGMSFCSPKDHFSKKKGRTIALARLNNGSKKNFTIKLANGHPGLKKKVYLTFLQICMRGWFTENCKVPGWIRKAAYDDFHDSYEYEGEF